MTTEEVNNIIRDIYQKNWFPVWQQVDRTYLENHQTIPVRVPRIETLTEDEQYGELPFHFYCDYIKERNRIYQLRYINKEGQVEIITL